MERQQRRPKGEHSVTFIESRGKYRARAWLGYDLRGKAVIIDRYGTSKSSALAALREALRQRELGNTRQVSKYTVQDAVGDWFAYSTSHMSAVGKKDLLSLSRKNIEPHIGKAKIQDLKPRDVERWLAGLTESLSKGSLDKLLSILSRSLDRAVSHELAIKNVAKLVAVPQGRDGRKSKSFTAEQADAILNHPMSAKLKAYISLSMLTGIRTEEARVLRWSDFVEATDEDTPPHIYVVRSVRAGGDTKTRTSRRAVAVPLRVVRDLNQWRGETPFNKPQDIIFCTSSGRPLDASGMRRRFRAALTGIEGIDPSKWAPRELRHSFVSLMSDSGVPVEQIALLVGHRSTSVTELVYRHQLRPVLRVGNGVMDARFGTEGNVQSSVDQ